MQNCVTTLQLRNMLQPFEKGKTLVEQAMPVAQLLLKIGEVLKEVDGVKKQAGQRNKSC